MSKEDYAKCKADMLAAEEETQHTYQKKKAIGAERKEAKLGKEEVKKYRIFGAAKDSVLVILS